MGFFDDLGKKVTDAGQKTIQKTREMSETVKINSLITDEEKRLNRTYSQIGELFVSMYGENCDEAFAGMVSNVLECRKKIEQYHNQIQEIKGVQRCEKCGAEVPRGAAFCSTCGAEMPQIQMMNQERLVKCENCGAMMKEETRFCTQCGKPVSDSEITDGIEEENVSIEEEEERTCSNCGAKIIGDSAFCTECGYKLEK